MSVDALVAAGHPRTADAAIGALAAGGNAFDAAVAAGFMATVSEPCLTSLAGGGFLLARTAAGTERLVDFFVDVPGIGRADTVPHFVPVTVEFPASTQDFNVGWGSAATPGVLDGLLHVHRTLGRLDLETLVAPAITAAADGVILNEQQGGLVALLEPILRLTPESAAVFAPDGRLLQVGDRCINTDLAEFLREVGAGRVESFAEESVAGGLVAACDRNDGLLTRADLEAHRVVDREPAVAAFRGRRVLTNPLPSFGGPLLALALALLDDGVERSAVEHAVHCLEVMRAVEGARLDEEVESRLKIARGTTHLSVSDAEGNVASMTTSNGEGAGCVIPGTGVMLNNMMGEDDLHPAGFHTGLPGARVSSMMSPAVVVDGEGRSELVLGSGGSKRIRSAILAVLDQMVDGRAPALATAVEAPRFHWDGSVTQVEPGFSNDVVDALEARAGVNLWAERNLYFGGVHAVRPGVDAGGDPRRGGSVGRLVR